MNVKTILKIHKQQKYLNIFYQDFQYLQYRHLKAQKINIMYTEIQIA